MAGQVYAVASGKGGVGKTTTAVSLGAAAVATGRSVVVVDADLGMPNVADVLDVADDAATVHDVLAGDAGALEALAEAPGGVDVLAGDPSVEKFGGADPAALGDAVDALRAAYDLVLLDTGAGLSHATVVPLGVADAVVLVATLDPAAVRDARKTRDLAGRFGGDVAGLVVVGDGDPEPEAVADNLDVPLLAAVPDDPAVRESAVAGEPLAVHAPDGSAATAYRDAATALLDDGGSGDDEGEDRRAVEGDGPDADDAEEASVTDADATPDDGSGSGDATIPDAEGVTFPDPDDGAVVPDDGGREGDGSGARSEPTAGGDAAAIPDDEPTADDAGPDAEAGEASDADETTDGGADGEQPDDESRSILSRLTGGRIGD